MQEISYPTNFFKISAVLEIKKKKTNKPEIETFTLKDKLFKFICELLFLPVRENFMLPFPGCHFTLLKLNSEKYLNDFHILPIFKYPENYIVSSYFLFCQVFVTIIITFHRISRKLYHISPTPSHSLVSTYSERMKSPLYAAYDRGLTWKWWYLRSEP